MPYSLNEKIKHFYDASSHVWVDRWGEHMHHGYYGQNGKDKKDRLQAQEDMITELLKWADVRQADFILDLGCGAGGSARFLHRKLGAYVLGVTLSPVQTAIAHDYNIAENTENKIVIKVQDMLTLKNSDERFDLIWSLESAEHIENKAELMHLCYELLHPGGTLVMATWCIREEQSVFSSSEQKIIDRICRYYHLPPMKSIEALNQIAMTAGFSKVKTADWSMAVSPFWSDVMKSAMSWKSLTGLIRAGWSTIKGAWAMQYMQRGYRNGLIQYGVLQARK